jgi:long-chain acyl-CoA synthetase
MEYKRQTINALLKTAVGRYGDREFMRYKSSGKWLSLSFNEVARKVRQLALGLHALGFRAGDRIGIWSENRPEWNIADLAVLAIGAVDVPIYTTQARHEIEYILTDAGARAIFVSSGFVGAAAEIKKSVKTLRSVISFDGDTASDDSILSFQDILASGERLDRENPGLYDQLSGQVVPDDLASQIYTSGTTGEPKGVMLTHGNLSANTLFSYRWLELDGRTDIALSYLPLSHIFERGTWYTFMYAGFVVAYAESIEAVPANLAEIRPTVMTSVPRMFEKMYARMMEKGLASPFPRRQIFLWAMGIARAWADRKNRGVSIGPLLALEHKIADTLVYAKLRQAVGGRVRDFISGGAALAPEIAYVFMGAGLRVLQGYGLTETSPSISCNTEQHNRIGTVGRVLDGVEVRIASDGEILVKGETVTKGYFNSPDKNREAFTEDGWFCTGDIGVIDQDGFLSITDRKKDLFKTSGGKYVAPQRIESLIMSSRFVSQVVVVGNERKFASALIVPNIEMLRGYAQLKGIKYDSDHDLICDPRVKDLIHRQVDKHTHDLARYEKVKKIALLEHELTTASGELTATMKPRRKFIEQKYASVIDSLYLEPKSEAASDTASEAAASGAARF